MFFSLQHAVFIWQRTMRVADLLSCIPKLVFYEPFLQFPDETGHCRLQPQDRNPAGPAGTWGLSCHLCTRSPSPAFSYQPEIHTSSSSVGTRHSGCEKPYKEEIQGCGTQKKPQIEVPTGLPWGWRPAKPLPRQREAKLSSFPWLASPAVVCAASRQDALTGQGTGGTGRATTHCLQVPGFSVTETVLETGLK